MKKVTFFGMMLIAGFGLSFTAFAEDSVIPDWIKNNAKWWSDGSISDADYIESLEYLINNGIIDVTIPIADVTAAQTMYSNEERAQSFRVTISNIVEPLPVHFFEKFEFDMLSNVNEILAVDRGRIYEFRADNPKFFLESLPSADKKQFYDFVADWMDRGIVLNEFDVDVDVLDGTGAVIQTWAFTKCGITGYGTYLQDTIFIYSFSGISDSEIRDRANFSCAGVNLETP